MARTSRVCPQPRCPTLTQGGPCAEHARPSPQARGYDHQHRATRADWVPRVAAGTVTCWRCDQPIQPGEPWDLGHDDADRTITRGPEHARRCNRAAAGRAAQEGYR